MTDQLISFETAKLAKEKGFNIPVHGMYVEKGYEPQNYPEPNESAYNWNSRSGYSAPTQSLLQKWLREKHNIHFVIKIFYDSKLHKTTYTADPIELGQGRTKRILPQDTYEEALEAGLIEALKLIS